MLPIYFVREHPDEVRRALARRNMEAPLDEVLAKDAERRRLLTELESLRAERNAI
jgi:seryl-tRNA synthetase